MRVLKQEHAEILLQQVEKTLLNLEMKNVMPTNPRK